MKQTGIFLIGLSLLFLALILVLAKAAETTVGDIVPFLSYLLIFLVFISGVIITYTNKDDNS